MIVLCVLKSGGDYAPKHAVRLYDQFLRHAPPEVGFLCLSDLLPELQRLNVPATHLVHGWPGWWSKLEALAAPGPALYLDMDVSITGDLKPLFDVARATPLCMCRGFWGGDDPNPWNSSVMAWAGDASPVYRAFGDAPQAHMSTYKGKDRWGDQAFIKDHWPGGAAGIWLWQEEAPGRVLSFKRDILRSADYSHVSVIVSHGHPRPWEPGGADEWAKRHGL